MPNNYIYLIKSERDKSLIIMNGSETVAKESQRFRAPDALRGPDMFRIIGGSAIVTGLAKAVHGPMDLIVSQFEHFRREGLHFSDLIWPLSMFIAGISTPLPIMKRKAEG
jgi:predicted acyltransferase